MPHKDPELRKKYQLEYREKNKAKLQEKALIRGAEYRKKNKEKISKYQKEYVKRTRSHINEYCRNRRKNSVEFKLATNLRTRLYLAIKNNIKNGSSVKDLGCSIDDFKKHIESLFKEGMSWENWGRYGWHLDHIKPLTSFNLENIDEFRRATHYSNLQPMWWRDNISKGGYKKTTVK